VWMASAPQDVLEFMLEETAETTEPLELLDEV
jgi:hypothetical protein